MLVADLQPGRRRYYLDLPDAEIARAVRCRPNTVKSHRAKALASLRLLLADRGVQDTEGDQR